MAVASRLEGDHYVNGNLSSKTFTAPSGSITNDSIQASAGISASKTVRHESINVELFGPAVSVAAVTKWLHIVRGATGTIVAFEAAIAVAADDVSRTIDVDLHKSTGGGSFASVLSASADFTNSSTVRVPVAATISSAGLVDGDILAVVVAVAGGSGNQATGLTVTLTIEETYQ